ncbi:hypothetical protein K883_00019 [Mycobacterium sp. TKK-01-0059]|nr:hypothetical protein K883_00019 [Mycobacterium sp. TKK-01-0059]OCB21744.1 hypothetical protein A5644_16775 [Mycobacterium intracellulare subsp. yongonense]
MTNMNEHNRTNFRVLLDEIAKFDLMDSTVPMDVLNHRFKLIEVVQKDLEEDADAPDSAIVSEIAEAAHAVCLSSRGVGATQRLLRALVTGVKAAYALG